MLRNPSSAKIKDIRGKDSYNTPAELKDRIVASLRSKSVPIHKSTIQAHQVQKRRLSDSTDSAVDVNSPEKRVESQFPAVDPVNSPDNILNGTKGESADKPHSDEITDPVLSTVRSIPTVILYDERGLELFDAITGLEEYYLTNAEADILKKHSQDIVTSIVPKSAGTIKWIELGVGSMKKLEPFLASISSHSSEKTEYFALDVSDVSLNACLAPLHDKFHKHIDFIGLQGTYEDAVALLPQISGQKCVMWLGSSIGNFTRDEAESFLSSLTRNLAPGDFILLGVDAINPGTLVKNAYCDSQGVTRDFILNGLKHVNSLFVANAFDETAWEYISVFNQAQGRHEAYYESLIEQELKLDDETIQMKKGEWIHVEYSVKYNPEDLVKMGRRLGWSLVNSWKTDVGRNDITGTYGMYLFQLPSEPNFGVPSLKEWDDLWHKW